MRLGVSPAAAPTPTGVFNERFEVLFPRTGALGCVVCFATHCSSWFIYARMWGHGVLPAALPAPFVPHSASLGPATAMRILSALAARLRPSYRSGCMFLFYLLGVGLTCHSIFCQFWLCEEAQCVYLRCHVGSLREFLIELWCPFIHSLANAFYKHPQVTSTIRY